MLAIEQPEDLVIATGRLTTVRDFLGMVALAAGFKPAFEHTGLEETCTDANSGMMLARVSPKYFRVHDTPPLAGDSSRLRKLTGWAGSRPVERLAEEMVTVDIERWKNGVTNV